MCLCSVSQACESHESVWKCAIEGSSRYGRNCITRADIHVKVKENANIIVAPLLLALEGKRYQSLFDDCDINQDNCITYSEAIESESCIRDCRLRLLFKSLICSN